MTLRPSFARACACAGLALALVGANLPPAMVGPGEWEIAGTAGVVRGQKRCLMDPALLMQWEHRTSRCTRTIMNSSLDRAEVSYTCAGGGFGTSRVQVLTPRSVKVSTQGIAGGLPFGYVLHARRVGPCTAR